MTHHGRNSNGGESALAGANRVAALMLVMDKPHADRILRHLSNAEIRALARSASALPAISIDKVGELVDELARALEVNSGIVGSSDGAHSLLQGVISEEEIEEIMAELAGEPPRRIWSRLQDVADERLANFIATEQSQVAVFVLANLPAGKASSVLERLDLARRAELSSRLLSMKPIAPSAQRLVADRLAMEMFGEAEAVNRTSNHARLGAILNQLEPSKAEEIIERLASSSRDDARKVRRYLFSFSDLSRLSPEDRARVCEGVPVDQLVMALRDAGTDLRSDVLAVLSPRTARLIAAEITREATVQPSAILEARRAIATLALTLAENGQIAIAVEGETPPE